MNTIIYEQPVNELIRVCLRLEHLFQQVDYHLKVTSDAHTRDIVRLIIDLLNVLNRPDLKSKLAQEFQRLSSVFTRMENSPDVHKTTLKSTVEQLNKLTHSFVNTQRKLAQDLRDLDFIETLRAHLSMLGGDSDFEVPGYHYWLKRPASERKATLNEWLSHFDKAREAVNLLLSIIRRSNEPRELTADRGFFHESISAVASPQLVRVLLPHDADYFPEVSVGKHRLNIRFCHLSLETRPQQVETDVPFQLMLCCI